MTGSMTAVVKNMDRAMADMNLERVRSSLSFLFGGSLRAGRACWDILRAVVRATSEWSAQWLSELALRRTSHSPLPTLLPPSNRKLTPQHRRYQW